MSRVIGFPGAASRQESGAELSRHTKSLYGTKDFREKRRRIESRHLRPGGHQGRGSFHLENVHLICTLLRAVLCVSGMLRRGERNALDSRLRTLEFEFANLPASFEGFRILHLSDIHADGLAGLAEASCARLRGLEADLCVLTGDYRYDIEGSCAAVYPEMGKILACVRAKHGVVGILGNHDFAEKIVHLERMGVRVLMNDSLEIRRGIESIWICGVDDPHYYGCDDLPGALAPVPEGAFKVLLAHSPELYEEAADRGIDLYLCGHTHAGQVCLPGGIPIVLNTSAPRRFARGIWRHGHVQGYTSAGIGCSLLPVRFNCPPEITLIELRTKQEGTGAGSPP
ncbi:MAG: metallophosphoesterase [Acidobacteria bacterium]|nr:metallophosphoesterase [Acidobacteriota bacterium]